MGTLVTSAAVLTGCSSTEECGLSPASVQINGHEYYTDSRHGTPLRVGRELPQPVALEGCDGTSASEVPAHAIRGIPTTVAVYAPAAFGEEFILINEDAVWRPRYVQRLTGADAS